ncbi:MAG: YDG/SRA domain-containing protein [Lysobacterales bacterium]
MRVFGEIEGIAVGTEFASRAELAAAGIHKPTQAGISGSTTLGADSIVVSGGYEDDEDYGDYLIYGGQVTADVNTKRQVADAELTRGNLALVVSCNRGLPVRVTRGLGSTKKRTYRYDGLYRVERWWADTGKSGFKIYCFALRKIDDQPISTPAGELPLPSRIPRAERVKSFTTRTVRDTMASERVKRKHDYRCQACSTRIEHLGGAYAEAVHIKPLGRPHNGPDKPGNILCLCPNCHVLFDAWAFTIEEDGTLTGALQGKLNEIGEHRINRDFLAYHRRLYRAANT